MEKETLEYALADLQRKVDNILLSVDELRKGLPNIYVSKEIYHSEMSDLERRIAILEAQSSKVTWAILGAAGSVAFTVIKAFLGI